ncbi:MAG TPA: hypothetical protein VLB84_03900, partial [Bacteroidia bacterium]|nr:hypothetical protein [Bacteroidia bacterium]
PPPLFSKILLTNFPFLAMNRVPHSPGRRCGTDGTEVRMARRVCSWIRIGWLITKNKKLQETFLAAKEQIFLCNSVVDEEIARQFLKYKIAKLRSIEQHVKVNFDILKNWIKTQPYLEWIEPEAGVICFPRLKKDIHVNMEAFYHTLYHSYKTLVGPGHWFDMDKRYMRIGFGWPSKEALQKGLENITLALNQHLQ